MARPNIVAAADLPALAARLRAEGKRLVTANGCFDVLHPGHAFFLAEAKAQGDVLIVAVNVDEYLRRTRGPGRPANPLRLRQERVAALGCVDFVTELAEDTPVAFLRAVRPDVHVNGAEYGERCVEAPVCREIGARLHLVRRIPGPSSTDLIRRGNRGP
jgi:rfaE bifunctional protein nucleotidyltransferase chain/domain